MVGILKKAPLAQVAVPQQTFHSDLHGWSSHGEISPDAPSFYFKGDCVVLVILLQCFPRYFLLCS